MRILLCAALCSVFSNAALAALTPDNLLLITNKNVPDSRKLADHYAQARNVPEGRIVELDLSTADDIAVDEYDEKMVAPIREFILSNRLEKKVGCLVTFYGVPLRIPNRANTPELKEEIVSLRKQLNQATKQVKPLVEGLEQLAGKTDATFQSPAVAGMDQTEALSRRADHAANFVAAKITAMPAGAQRDELLGKLRAITDQIRGPVTISEATTAPAASQPATTQSSSVFKAAEKMAELSLKRASPEDRRAFRDLVRQHAGLITFMQVVAGQELYLTPDDSEASVDNELAILWWGLYPRFRWQPNPLNYKYAELRAKPTMMVMRLDGAGPDQVRSIIDTSIKVEQEGLQGRVVLDSRGIAPQNASGRTDLYGVYDQSIRNLEVLLHTRSKLPMLVDDRAALIPPGAVKDCGVYCGWYSPGKYVNSVSFVPGAIAMHIASYEMTTLHNATEAWCRNQLDAGAVATVGPVAEPYLHAFPAPDEFFPVLFTGQLTLAETYWSTNPLVSWKMAIVGDPLYTPFKKSPALKPQDLPARMRGMFTAPTTQPAKDR
jgi:uncharacterized protein (TIGR03790 family)